MGLTSCFLYDFDFIEVFKIVDIHVGSYRIWQRNFPRQLSPNESLREGQTTVTAFMIRKILRCDLKGMGLRLRRDN